VNEERKTLKAEDALAAIQRQIAMSHRDHRLTIRISNPGGLTAHQTVDAAAIHGGFDWEAGQLVIEPAKPLTWLTPEDVAAIHESMKKGQSWHAYQREKHHCERLSEALGVKVTTILGALREIEKLRKSPPSTPKQGEGE
jgi:hypothetical protein